MSIDKKTASQLVNGEIDFKIKGVSGAYPETDNCYIIDIVDKNGDLLYTNHYFNKETYNLYVIIKNAYLMMKPVLKTENHKKAFYMVLDQLVDGIDAYGDQKYSEASMDAAMEGNEDA